MARSSHRPTRVSRFSFIQLIRGGPSPAAKGLLLAAMVIAAGVWFWWSPGSRSWFVESLGYGWIPVGLWLAVAITAVAHYRSAVRKSWQWCVAAAALAAISIGVLSLFHTASGTLAETGLSGSWGRILGGSPLGLAVAKLAAIALLSPLLLLSRPVGRVYWQGLIYIGLAFYYTPVYIYKGLRHGWQFVDQRIRPLVASVWRFFAQAGGAMLRRVPARRRHRQDAPKAVTSSSTGPWADAEVGTIPNWPSDEEDPLSVVPARAGRKADQPAGPHWQLPSIELLSPPETRENSQAELQEMGRNIENTLTDHGVVVEVKEIKAGPRVVQFGLVPGWLSKKRDAAKGEDDEESGQRSRIKVRDILGREQDLALALQTPYLRIEAPIPGEGLVGLEVPNPSPAKVHLREVMSNQSFNSLVAKNGLRWQSDKMPAALPSHWTWPLSPTC